MEEQLEQVLLEAKLEQLDLQSPFETKEAWLIQLLWMAEADQQQA